MNSKRQPLTARFILCAAIVSIVALSGSALAGTSANVSTGTDKSVIERREVGRPLVSKYIMCAKMFEYDGPVHNDPPEILSRVPQRLDVVPVNSTIQFSVDAYDVDGNPLYYSWTHSGTLIGHDSGVTITFPQAEDAVSVVCWVSDGWDSVYTEWDFAVMAEPNQADPFPHTPLGLKLGTPYPNPFNSATRIDFTVNTSQNVRIAVYDILGREVAVLADGLRPAGNHSVIWNADKLGTGTYLVRAVSNTAVQTQRITLVR